MFDLVQKLQAEEDAALAALKKEAEAQRQLGLKQLSAEVPKQIELVALVSCSAQASLDVVAQITSPTLLLELACNAPTTQIRQTAAERLDGRAELEQLAKVAQNKDKTVFKIAKTKLDIFKAEDATRAQYHAQLNGLCEKMEKLATHQADHLYKGKVLALNNEWQHDAIHAPEDIMQRFQKALEICQTRIAERAEIIAKEEETILLDAQAKSFVDAAVTDAKQLIVSLYAATHIDAIVEADFNKKLHDLTQAVRLAASRNISAAAQIAHFEELKTRAQNLVEQLKQSGPVHELVAALQTAESSEVGRSLKNTLQKLLAEAKDFSEEQLPPIVEQAKQGLQQWNIKQKNLEEQAKNVFKEITDLSHRGLRAAEQGFVRRARSIHKELAEKRQQLAELPAAIAAKLDDLDGVMHKLGDWHEFAVTPKKEELITQMQGLAGSRLIPEDLATKIHELQDQWKALSRGGQQSDETLWEQFQQASATAFAPCKEYFDRQAQERDRNLEKRATLVAQLQDYLKLYDWPNAVWKDVDKTLKLAREEWKTYWPVPRKAASELQVQFDALLEELHGKIKAEYQTNKDWKQKIIAEVASLKDSVDTSAAAEKVKQLQTQWKAIGKSWPKDEQTLWNEFRAHCDAIFEKRKQVFEEANAQREAVIATAKDLIGQLKAQLELSPEQLAAGKQKIAEIKEAFEALGELPRQAAKELSSQYHRHLDEIKLAAERARQESQVKSWQHVEVAAELVRQYELAQLNVGDIGSAKTAVTEFFAQVEIWPAATYDILQKRFGLPFEVWHDQLEAHAKALSVLALRAEILTQRDTPDAYKSERMAYQVEQLKNGFAERREYTLEQLFLEWISVPGVADNAYAPAWERFNACR